MTTQNIGVSTAIILDKQRILKNGKHPVKLRIISQRIAKYYTLKGESCSSSEFEAIYNTKARGKNKQRRKLFDDVEDRAIEIIKNLYTFTFTEFENEFRSKKAKDRSIKAYFDNKVAELNELEKVSTASNYRSTHSTLIKFDENISFEKITPKYLKDFEKWFVEQGNSYTSVGIYMRNLRHIINLAKKDRASLNYPFGEGKDKYQIPVSNNIKKALNFNDITKLFEYETDSEQEKTSLNYWLFSYLCNGMNFTDILNLKYSNLSNGSLIFIRQKTKDTSKHKTQIQIPILPQVQQIINELGNKEQAPENYIFPVLKKGLTPKEVKALIAQHIKTTNKYMKRIASKVGITESITTYYARHTYSTVLRDSGASTEFIAEQLGHQSTKVTKSYLDGFKQEIKKKYQQNLIPNKD